MARQEATNSFTEGLITDLHPLNTPNTVLTDCLNGTLITYNGNEFILQNDMGNYELQNCKLPMNFIPVGIKGYADVLYIVSYNPFTEEIEIGSYPAPQSIFSTGDTNKTVEDSELPPFYFGSGTFPIENTYNDAINTQKKALFIFMDGVDSESTKLYSGDEFSIEGLSEDYLSQHNLFIYQHLNFYVIDENNKLYDIDDEDIYLAPSTEDGYRKVFWETPGWLAAQYDLYVPDKFNLNLRSLNLPEFILNNATQKEEKKLTASMDLSAQLTISDQLFINELNKHTGEDTFDHLYIRFLVNDPESTVSNSNFVGEGATQIKDQKNPTTEEGAAGTLVYDIPCKWHNYQDDILTAYINWTPTWNFDMPKKNNEEYDLKGYKVKVVAYPVIKYPLSDESTAILKYTQFRTELSYELDNLKDIDNIYIGNQIYKWAVDDNSCTISFNIDGPFVNARNITGKYNIYRLNYFRKEATISNTNLYSESSWTYLRDDSKQYDDPDKPGEDWNCLLATNSPNNRLLMMSGNIPNLSLYGQNTINLFYDNSKSYTLTDYYQCTNYNKLTSDRNDMSCESMDKKLKFEKEGGIYMFEIILEQGTTELTKKEFLLIPSVLFNDWFGELDNYLDSITSSQWLGKYLDNLTINSIINSISIDFKGSKDPESEKAFKLKYGNNKSVTFNPNPSEDTDDILLKQIQEACDNSSQSYEWASMPNQFTYEIDVSKLVKGVVTNNTTLDLTPLQGNLWNPVTNGNFSLYTNTGDVLLTKDQETGLWTFNKKLVYDWNIESSNQKDKHKENTPEEYPFSNIKTTSPGGVYPNAENNNRVIQLLAYGGSRSKNSVDYKIYIKFDEEMTEITHNIASNKQNYDMNSSEVQHFGRILNAYGVRWGIVDFYRQDLDTGTNWRGYWVYDSDDNPDRSFTDKLPIVNNHVDKYYIVLFAGNGDYIKWPNTTIALEFSSNDERQKFVAALLHIKAYDYSAESTSVYYPKFNISNIIENESVTINKMELNCNILMLRIDDENWLDPSEYLLDLNSKLIEKPQILLSKQQTISFSNTLVNIDYMKNNLYEQFVDNVAGWFNTYADNVQVQLNEFNDLVGTSFIYAPAEKWTNNSNLTDWFPTLELNPEGNQKEAQMALVSKIIKNLGRWDIQKPYTDRSNVIFKNTNFGTIKLVCAKIDDDYNSTTDDSGCFYASYWQNWSNE